MLQAGGTAVDAAVAVQMVLALVEPQATGLGAGAFLVHYDGKQVEAYDGRETAPAGADERQFLQADGRPMPFSQAVTTGVAVGVPGAVRMLELAHREHGKLPWARLFQPAIRLAESGFRIGPRMYALASHDTELKRDPVAAAYFLRADGQVHEPGQLLRNPDLAYVLRRIAAEGSNALHEGEVARAIVERVHRSARPGTLSMADMAGYQARKRDALCHDYRASNIDYRLCGMPPPSSGTIVIGQVLGMLRHTPAWRYPLEMGRGGVPGTTGFVPSTDFLYLYLEASRMAFADRAQYIADPDFIAAPPGGWSSLLDAGYLADRAKLIDASPAGRSMKDVKPGTPGGARTSHAPMPEQEEHGTSHISIVDEQGNALAMTTTVEAQFGSRMMVNVSGRPGGFLLNNELTDFSFVPADADGRPVANRVQPGKRPRSSMAPTLVFHQPSGRFVMATGSSGGAMIIHYTAKSIFGVLNWGMNVQQAIDLPNFGVLDSTSLLEAHRFPPQSVEALRRRGARVLELELTSGTHAIQSSPSGFYGGADPRREGLVLGD